MAYDITLKCLFAIYFFLFSAEEVRAKISAVIAFGDSTIDAGNNKLNLAIFKCNFKPYGQNFKGGKPTGRWSNGRVFADFISDALGIKSSIPAYLDTNSGIEDFATGVTFGSGGAGYDNLTSTLVGAIPLWKQLEFFKEYKEKLTNFQGEEKAAKIIREALYIVSIGTNDFMFNYLTVPIRPLQFNIVNFEILLAENDGKFIKDLYNLGARKIALGGTIPMGCLPFARNLNIQLVYADGYTPLAQMVQTPSKYGFEEVKVGCCGTGKFEIDQLCTLAMALLCKDPTKYMYWDAIHLTDTANGLLADSLLKTSLAKLI
ncbi:GDSL esterase/lipase At2g04570-like [Papaver somniferum]|uniref:GDSL esterase/lipase At2g04570-like n=1 Tax=Papaver somniferum TaxID=3469 RepID=UPI000E6FF2FD|nr:GDSL esterase/lipase At2g04570-like [Papaver somniferum]